MPGEFDEYAGEFDDLADEPAAPPKPAPSKAQSFGRGALQGASLSFGDEIGAAIDTGLSHVARGIDAAAGALGVDTNKRSFARGLERINQAGGGSGGGLPLNEAHPYGERRGSLRAKNEETQTANPTSYGIGQVVGGVATAGALPALGAAGTLGRALGAGALVGGVNSAGASEGPLGWRTALETAQGAGQGALLGGLLHGATKVPDVLAGSVARSEARAPAQGMLFGKPPSPTNAAFKEAGKKIWDTGHYVAPLAKATAIAADEGLAAIARKIALNKFALRTATPAAAEKIQAEIATLEHQAAPHPMAAPAEPGAPAAPVDPTIAKLRAALAEAEPKDAEVIKGAIAGLEEKAARAKPAGIVDLGPGPLPPEAPPANPAKPAYTAGPSSRPTNRVGFKAGDDVGTGEPFAPSEADAKYARGLSMSVEDYRAMMTRRSARMAAASPDLGSLHKFIGAAKAGNPFAQKTLKALAATPEGMAKITAAELEAGMDVAP